MAAGAPVHEAVGAAPAISVIVPFHGEGPHLRACIESLLDQTLPQSSYEVLFVDNGSTNGAASVVAGYPGIRLLRESRRGAYLARNRALVEARGEIVAFTDADCRVERNWLEEIEAGMRPPEVGILLGRRAAGGGGVMRLVADYEARKTAYVLNAGMRELVFGHTNCMAVRRRVLD